MDIDDNAIIKSDDLLFAWRIVQKNWYVLVVFAVVGFLAGLLYTHKMIDIYSAKAQILISPEKGYFNDKLPSSFNIFGNGYEQLHNEMRILKSTPILNKAAEKLDLSLSYYTVGRIKTEPISGVSLPFETDLKVYNSSLFEMPIHITAMDEYKYEVSYEVKDISYNEIGFFNQPLINKHFYLLMKVRSKYSKYLFKNYNYLIKAHRPGSLVSKFKQSISIRTLEYTAILEITIKDEVLPRAIEFLDSLCYVYVENSMKARREVSDNTLAFIDDQMNQVSKEMNLIGLNLEMYKEDASVLNLAKEEEIMFNDYVGFQSAMKKIDYEVKTIDKLYEYIIDDDNNQILPPQSYVDAADPFLVNAVNELYQMRLLINEELYTSTLLNNSIDETERRITLIKKDIISYLNNEKVAKEEQVQDLGIELRKYEDMLKKFPKTHRDIINIQRRLEVNEQIYSFLLEKRAEANIVRSSIAPTRHIVEYAHSSGVVGPDKKKIWTNIFIIVIVIFVGVTAIRTFLFDSIESTAELKSITNIPVIGELVSFDTDEPYLVVNQDPKSMITESFRALRANLNYMLDHGSSKRILITSFNAGEGKTYSAINLAAILASAGKKVLLVELDLHRPKFSKGFSISNEKGVSTVLIGKHRPEEALSESSIDNLDIMLSGPPPPNPSELILSQKMQEVLDFGKENYDFTVIDTPPVGLLTDALNLMHDSDVNLFVLRAKIVKKGIVRKAIEIKEQNNLPGFAFILNDISVKKSKYYYAYSGYGYGY
ncbi:MAG: polysaccharide biosynthesis tyrosine autokinase, partial [Flavobacteriales bacterium]|nr:polysaccharide biosynthesis tyrosine autokinase [Flavobacteriales bacterium]